MNKLNRPIIAIEFDGVITNKNSLLLDTSTEQHIRKMTARGYRFVLQTNRTGEALKEALGLIKKWKLAVYLPRRKDIAKIKFVAFYSIFHRVSGSTEWCKSYRYMSGLYKFNYIKKEEK